MKKNINNIANEMNAQSLAFEIATRIMDENLVNGWSELDSYVSDEEAEEIETLIKNKFANGKEVEGYYLVTVSISTNRKGNTILAWIAEETYPTEEYAEDEFSMEQNRLDNICESICEDVKVAYELFLENPNDEIMAHTLVAFGGTLIDCDFYTENGFDHISFLDKDLKIDHQNIGGYEYAPSTIVGILAETIYDMKKEAFED